MSETTRHETDNRTTNEPTMFAEVPTAPREGELLRELPSAAREAALDAVERALARSIRLRHALPATPGNPPPEWLRSPPSAAGGEAPTRRMSPRPSLDPVKIVPPPDEAREGASAGRIVAWATGAVTFAALAAFLVVGVVPPFGGATEDTANATALAARAVPERAPAAPPKVEPAVAPAPAVSADQAALVERFVALRQQAEPQPQPQSSKIVPQPVRVERVLMPQAALPAPPPQAAPAPQPVAPPQAASPNQRALDREELAVLAERSRVLIEQGDIASARLMLTRAAEAGDAASALALGTTYDPDALKKLGVIGVMADPRQAHAWYTRALELGAAEATFRLERLAAAR